MADIATQIRHAVEALSTNSQNQGRRLRELLDDAPAVFQQVVAAMLASARDTPELRYVIALLNARGLLVPMLRDLSSKDRGAAGVVAQLAQRMDPRFDRAMVRQGAEPRQVSEPYPGSAAPHLAPTRSHKERSKPDPEFLLGLLDALSGGLCLMPMLAPLRESEDPRIRARMALLLGRITRAQDWFHALERDEDPRVRANVVESLWSVGGESSSECFARGLKDPHHRVVANSLVGLYLQGDTSAVSGVVRMAEHDTALFRAAAAWAMGRTGDTRFLHILRQMRRGPDQDSMVVRNALHAVARINQATVAATRRETVLTCLHRETSQECSLDAIVTARDSEPGPLPVLKSTDWQLRANHQPVWSYEAEFFPAASALGMGFVLPAAPAEDAERLPQWNAAFRATADWRRPNDQFAASLYAESAGSHFQNGLAENLRPAGRGGPSATSQLRADPATVLAVAHHATGPIGSLNHLAATLDPAYGDLHLILVLDVIPESNCQLDELPGLLSALLRRKIRLHCLSTHRATPTLVTAFRRLSAETGGFALSCPDVAGLAESLQVLISSTFGHYRLRCPLPPPVEQIEIELQAEGHQGKLLLLAGDASLLSSVAA